MPTTVTGLDEIRALAGQDLGVSSWTDIPQSRVDAFADAIAHGYLTLAMLIPLWSEILEMKGIGMAVNYGLNRVRFPAPVPAGSRIRLGASLREVTEVPGGIQTLVDFVVRCDDVDKPV